MPEKTLKQYEVWHISEDHRPTPGHDVLMMVRITDFNDAYHKASATRQGNDYIIEDLPAGEYGLNPVMAVKHDEKTASVVLEKLDAPCRYATVIGQWDEAVGWMTIDISGMPRPLTRYKHRVDVIKWMKVPRLVNRQVQKMILK